MVFAIEGLGYEVVLALSYLMVVFTLTLACTIYLILRRTYANGDADQINAGHNDTSTDQTTEYADKAIQTIDNVVDELSECPICLEMCDVSLRTDCGHIFCENCMETVFNNDMDAYFFGIKCPICRSRVFYFNIVPQGPENRIKESSIFVVNYNFHFAWSRQSKLIIDNLRETPLMLRQLFNELVNTGFSVQYLNVRVYLALIIGCIYLIMPVDVIPESIFGIMGFLDDIILIGIIAYYLAATYRNYVEFGMQVMPILQQKVNLNRREMSEEIDAPRFLGQFVHVKDPTEIIL